jgi:ABC-type transporter Mla maintaining outer membrane lipid asymmetry ATPase subunit MlaF
MPVADTRIRPKIDDVLEHGRLRDALALALGSGLPEVQRLSYARTSVTFRIADEGGAIALLLDQKPPRLSDAQQSTEIEITLSPEQTRAFARGCFAMPAAVINGLVSFSGPVRRYLEVDPILQRLLAVHHPSSDSSGWLAAPPSDEARRCPPSEETDLFAIETRGLHKRFGSHHVLSGATLQIPTGMIACVIGPSGTGKSVLLKHLIGLLRPDAGEILIRGRRLSRMRRSELVALRSEIGVMFQDGALFSTMNLYNNVAFPLRQHTDLAEDEIREVVEDRLAAVGLLEAAERLPAQLSGGMKKRAGLARALVLDPGIVLCDEPDSGLDPVRTALLAELLIEQHARNGGTMLVITHNIALARQISDHVSVLWKGEVIESGSFDCLANSETPLVRQFLAGAVDGPLGMD